MPNKQEWTRGLCIFLGGFDTSKMKRNIHRVSCKVIDPIRDITESQHMLVECILTRADVNCCAQYTCF